MSQQTLAGSTGLVRGIRRWDLVAVAINGIIGAGIFGLPSKVFALIGPYSLIAFVACGLVVSLIVLCFAEVASRFGETGGPYLYARAAFGSATGFEVGWLMWLARITAFAANCNLLLEYSGYFWPALSSGWTRAVVMTMVVTTLTIVNVIGIRSAALFSDVSTIAKLIPIVLFILVGLFFVNSQNFTPTTQPQFSGFSQSVMLLVYAFTGFEMALIPAGEVREPHRNLPFAILTALGVVAVLYILIQVVCIGTLPELATSKRPLADAGTHFLGVLGGSVITLGAIISILGNLMVLILAASRLPFAMAGQNELPQFFAATHSRYRTPHAAIWVTGAVMLAVTLSGTFIYAATISTIARLLAYITTCGGLIILRRRESEPAPFQAPLGILAAVLAILLMIWLLAHSTGREARDATVAVLAGLVIYAAYKWKSRSADVHIRQ
ncbi:MAG: amino acid permease [Acidobacteriota bacterium]|nr:amino acid permease [Acidobacteriota bacterium]